VRGRLDRILTQIFGIGVVHADPHPGHVHVTTDGDLVLPGLGPAGRREHARQLRLGQAITPIATHRAGPLYDGLLDLPAHRAGPKIDDRERPGARFRAQAFN
jgi:predicted unusual protein kinase regulating ubiquinone biosynthesis (AarF/ABC1/UbiB family)